jgi:hypothetical protein
MALKKKITKKDGSNGKNTAEAAPQARTNDVAETFKEPDKLLNVPKTLMKKEEWGMLTVLSLLLAGIFPAYFVNILLISFFTEVGHLFTTHLTELERQRLLEFEKEFSAGHELEKAGKWAEAVKVYEAIVPKYKDNQKIAGIAIQRIDWIEKNHLNKG